MKGSKDRLTDKAMDKLQTYYGNAIRANVKPGKLSADEQNSQIAVMQKAIMAVLYHTCELTEEKERHKYCPEGKESWCSYQENSTLKRKDHHLDAVFLDLLLPEFRRLSSYSLLLRCLPGYSQNANESLNGLVWNRAPKHHYKVPKSVEMAVMSAILHFNSGASSRHDVMREAGIPAGEFTSEGSAKKDKSRISRSIKKASMREKERRRKIRKAKLAAKEQIEEGEPSYSSGKYNEADPLCQADYSSDDDNIPLARLLPDADSDTDSDSSDNAPLAQLLLK